MKKNHLLTAVVIAMVIAMVIALASFARPTKTMVQDA